MVANYRAHHIDHSRPTETAILSVHNALVCSVNDGKVSVRVLLDLSAAFDTVDHYILLSLLSRRFCIRDIAHAQLAPIMFILPWGLPNRSTLLVNTQQT